jgi:hypothetical protein
MPKRKMKGPKKLATIATYNSCSGAAPRTPHPTHKRLREERKIERAAAAAVRRVAVEAKRLANAPRKEAAVAVKRAAAEAYKSKRAPARAAALKAVGKC